MTKKLTIFVNKDDEYGLVQNDASMFEKVELDLTDDRLHLLETFGSISLRPPAVFKRWYKKLDKDDKDLIDGICLAAKLGFNKELFDMSKFDENTKQLQEEKSFEKKEVY